MASRHLDAGTVVAGKYQLIARLGGGGMGEVYRAEHQLAGRTVALKILRPDFADDSNLTNRFFNEAKAVNRIKHPNIVEVFDAGYSPHGPYVAMEYLDGFTLAAALARVGKLTQVAAVSVLLPMLDALDAAHRHGIVHRDLKPENVFLMRVERDGPAQDKREPAIAPAEVRVKLLDFGIAKVLDVKEGSSPHTHTGIVFGTPDYLSPEQAAGEGVVDGRSDLFSVGIVLFELLTGHRPFEAQSAVATAYRIVHAEAPPLESFGVKVGPELEVALATALAKSPADRFASAAAFADVLAPLVPDGLTRREALRALLAKAVTMPPPAPPPPPPETPLPDPALSILGPTERPAVLEDMRSSFAQSVEMGGLAQPKAGEGPRVPAPAYAPTLASAPVQVAPASPLGRAARHVAPAGPAAPALPVRYPLPVAPMHEARDSKPGNPQKLPADRPSAPGAPPSPAVHRAPIAAAERASSLPDRPRTRQASQPEITPPSDSGDRIRRFAQQDHPPPSVPGEGFGQRAPQPREMRESPRSMPTAVSRGFSGAPSADPARSSSRGWNLRPLPASVRGKCHVRGTLPRAASHWVERSFGAAGRAEVLQMIPAEHADPYRNDGFNALVWYDLDALDGFLEAVNHALMSGDIAQWRHLARDNYDKDLAPIFRPAQRVSDAEALLRRMPANWARIYDFGMMRLGEKQWGRLNVKIDDFEGASLALRYVTIGTVEGMLRSAGFAGASVRVLSGEASFAREFEFEVMWVPRG